MNPLENKIFIKERNFILANPLVDFLQTNGFIVVDSSEISDEHIVPWVVFQSDSSSSTLIRNIQENHSDLQNPFPQMAFNIQLTKDQPIEHLYPHIETVVNIQLGSEAQAAMFEDQKMRSIHPLDLRTLIQSVGRIITKYMDNPPEEGMYTKQVLFKKTQAQTVGIIGLGYVGLPIAVAFAEKYNVIGLDINEQKIQSLTMHTDPAGEVGTDALKDAAIHFTSDGRDLEHCDYIIVAVPTPITQSKKPDVTYLVEASTMISKHLSIGTVVIFESTVYPGTTEEICIPLLETYSSLTAGSDFYVGYSPERMNPGDQKHTFKRNNKVVSGQNDVALKKISQLYESVVEGDIHKAPSMAVAEASKIVENAQRDINIAFMNELAIIFNTLDLDTNDVLRAAETKWNFLPFTPGLVGGHCIGIDPYYLMYKSQRAGYDPTFLAAAREMNDSIPQYIIQQLLYLLAKHAYNFENLQITVLGVTFKENISDIRNSKALEIVQKLEDLQMNVQLYDPHVRARELSEHTYFPLKSYDTLEKTDVLIIAVPHDTFSTEYKKLLNHLFTNDNGIIMDIKGVLPSNHIPDSITYWKL